MVVGETVLEAHDPSLGRRAQLLRERRNRAVRIIAIPTGEVRVMGLVVHDPERARGDRVEVLGERRSVLRGEQVVGEHEPVGVVPVVGEASAVELRVSLQLLTAEDRVESVHPPAVDREQAGPIPVRDRCRHHIRRGPQRDRRSVQELPDGRPVGTRVLPEIVIERPVLLHDEDHVLDRNVRGESGGRRRRRRSDGRRSVRREAERLL